MSRYADSVAPGRLLTFDNFVFVIHNFAKWNTNKTPVTKSENELVGIAEIANLANVTPQAVVNWRVRHADFPAPVADLMSGPVFQRTEVRVWLRRWKVPDAPCSMRWERFKAWLGSERGLAEGTINSRVSNCKTVERYEGDLDVQFRADGLAGVMDRLTYSKEDVQFRRKPKHKVPINGNLYDGTATLKVAVRLYREFRRSADSVSI